MKLKKKEAIFKHKKAEDRLNMMNSFFQEWMNNSSIL